MYETNSLFSAKALLQYKLNISEVTINRNQPRYEIVKAL